MIQDHQVRELGYAQAFEPITKMEQSAPYQYRSVDDREHHDVFSNGPDECRYDSQIRYNR